MRTWVLVAAACGSSPHPASNTVPPPPPAAPCGGSGDFNFAMSGHGFDAYDGKQVWAVAIERPNVIRLAGTITKGHFDLRCDKALHRNYDYPSYTVVIDADGNGICSAGDLQATREMYGWNFDITADFPTPDGWARVDQAHTVVGDRASFGICTRYFEP